MKMMKRWNAMLMLLTIAVAVACGKDNTDQKTPSEPLAETKKCLLIKKAEKYDTYYYKYDSLGKLSSIETINLLPWNDTTFIYKFEYNAVGKIEKVDKINHSSQNLELSTTYYYNPKGLLEEVKNIPVYNNSETFEYDAQNRVIRKNVFTKSRKYKYSLYFYLPNNLIREAEYTESNGSFSFFRFINWTHGTTRHPMSEFGYIREDLNPTVLFTDYVITRYTHPASPTKDYDVTIDYTYNSDGYPTKEVTFVDGKFYSENEYHYTCLD